MLCFNVCFKHSPTILQNYQITITKSKRCNYDTECQYCKTSKSILQSVAAKELETTSVAAKELETTSVAAKELETTSIVAKELETTSVAAKELETTSVAAKELETTSVEGASCLSLSLSF